MKILHPNIYLDAEGNRTDALLVKDGKIKAVGEEAKASDDDIVRPDAECIFPGLSDAHIHLWGIGQRLGGAQFSESDTPDRIYECLKSGAGQLETNDWIIGEGWDSNFWAENKHLSMAKLDELFPKRPVCLHRSDRHAIFINSEALRRSDISESYRSPGDGRLVRDAEGEFTGLIVDEAMRPIEAAIPPPTEEEDRQIMENIAERLVGHGITSAHMPKMSPERVSMLKRLERNGELPIRIAGMIHGPSLLESEIELEPERDDSAWLALDTIKYFADGALGSLGALLIDSYEDGTSGLEVVSKSQLMREAREFSRQGWQLAVHAIGDKAARSVVEVFSELPSKQRHRLEHAQMMTDGDIARMGNESIIASIQPIHLYSDCSWAHKIMEPYQLDRLYQFDELNRHCSMAGGSDYPVDDLNPWHGISVGMSRLTDAGHAFYPAKGLDIKSLLEVYTTGAAYAAHWENQLGRLHEGYQADFIALDREPFGLSSDEIWDMEVKQTWIAGKARK